MVGISWEYGAGIEEEDKARTPSIQTKLTLGGLWPGVWGPLDSGAICSRGPCFSWHLTGIFWGPDEGPTMRKPLDHDNRYHGPILLI